MTVGALTGTFLGDRGSVVSWCLAPIHWDHLQQRECNPELAYACWLRRKHKMGILVLLCPLLGRQQDECDSTSFPSERYLARKFSFAVIRKFEWWMQHSLFHNQRKKHHWPCLWLKDIIFPAWWGVKLTWGSSWSPFYFWLNKVSAWSAQPAVLDVIASDQALSRAPSEGQEGNENKKEDSCTLPMWILGTSSAWCSRSAEEYSWAVLKQTEAAAGYVHCSGDVSFLWSCWQPLLADTGKPGSSKNDTDPAGRSGNTGTAAVDTSFCLKRTMWNSHALTWEQKDCWREWQSCYVTHSTLDNWFTHFLLPSVSSTVTP